MQPSADVTNTLSACDYFDNVQNNRRTENDKQSEIINFIFLFEYILKYDYKIDFN